jgi:hypothetical protein
MDGKGSALDNVFVERFWRTITYEGYLPQRIQGRKRTFWGASHLYLILQQRKKTSIIILFNTQSSFQ